MDGMLRKTGPIVRQQLLHRCVLILGGYSSWRDRHDVVVDNRPILVMHSITGNSSCH